MATILNLRMLLKSETGPQHGQVMMNLSGRDFPGYDVEKPVPVTYSANREAGSLRLVFTAEVELGAACARCLEPASQVWTLERDLLIRPTDLDEEFPDLPIRPDGTMELEDLVYEELVMDAPTVILCRENCEGLCQTCGKPKAQCGCEAADEGDPRLQVLKQLLTDDSGES